MKKSEKIILGAAATAVLTRLALPVLIKRLIMAQSTDRMRVRVGDVRLSLLRGTVSLHQVTVDKSADGRGDLALHLSCSTVTLQVSVPQLAAGSAVVSAVLDRPQLTVVLPPSLAGVAGAPTPSIGEIIHELQGLIPVKVAKFDLHRGRLAIQAEATPAATDFSLTAIELRGRDLTASRSAPWPHLGQLEIFARPMGQAALHVQLVVDLTQTEPWLDMRVALRNLDLKILNGALQHYAKLELAEGQLTAYAELHVRKGEYFGTLEPAIRALEAGAEADEPITQKLWETVVNGVNDLFKNRHTDAVVTTVELHGHLPGAPTVDVPGAVWVLLENAFGEALKPANRHGISAPAAAPV